MNQLDELRTLRANIDRKIREIEAKQNLTDFVNLSKYSTEKRTTSAFCFVCKQKTEILIKETRLMSNNKKSQRRFAVGYCTKCKHKISTILRMS
jgi:hypothetical protein